MKCKSSTVTRGVCKRKILNGDFCWQHEPTDIKCPICWENISNCRKFCLQCNTKHVFHKQCIRKWILTDSTCPICRKDVSGYDMCLLGVKKVLEYPIELVFTLLLLRSMEDESLQNLNI